MLQGKRTRKSIAATFLAVMLTNILAPTVTYALTSGPTVPEATSFEPIDTTDMVNLQTGDLTYNIPLIEVPGPEGGYPLSLSYHAGIQPNEEASWVGLGWSLNPGAINRSVNGFPDDWRDEIGNSHTYWVGGSTTTISVGVSVGIANSPVKVGFGLSFSNDTYRGFGVGMNFTVGGGIGGPFSASVGIGMNPYAGGNLNAGIGASTGSGAQGLSASGGIGVSTNFESLNAGVSGGVGYSTGKMNTSLLGISLATNSGKASTSIGGLSAQVSSSKEAGIQTSSTGFEVDIPTPLGFNVSLGYSKVRYWTDEKTTTKLHGSLFSTTWEPADQVADNVAYDNYSLLENPEEKNIIDYPDPDKVQGGGFYDFDIYEANAQGLAGTFRPYIFQGELLGQNRLTSSSQRIVTYFSPRNPTGQPSFRFVGDFSNSFRQDYPTYSSAVNYRTEDFPLDTSPDHGFNDPSTPANEADWGYINGSDGIKLAGSKHVSTTLLVKPSSAVGYSSTPRLTTGMIEGFSITNEAGVTYHYGLPAYSYDEEITQQKVGFEGRDFNRQKKPKAYAYVWHLTTITGPDFVDRDGDGRAGVLDWGYWINFEYGKFSNRYNWRNPSQGFHRDEDNEWENCSMGKKELYYLNAIRTRSHVAIFEKDIRKDGKGSDNSIFTRTDSDRKYWNNGSFHATSGQSLLLSKIYLLNIADANFISPGSGGASLSPNETPSCPDCQIVGSITDRTDVQAVGRAALEAKAVRIIDFKYDYSLCKKTPNSFNMFDPNTKFGKLTLRQLIMRGYQGANILPPISFDYELEEADVVSQNGVGLSTTNFVTTNGNFQVGDMICRDNGGGDPTFAGTIITKKTDPSGWRYDLFNSDFVGSIVPSYVYTTKNPSYNAQAYDFWGMYKGDYLAANSTNENVARRTTPVSSKTTDAWSLRKIRTQLGSEIKINYEGKDYGKSCLTKNVSAIIDTIEQVSATTFKITTVDSDYDLRESFTVGSVLDALILREESIFVVQAPQPIGYSITNLKDWSTPPTVIGTINKNDITLQTTTTLMKRLFDEYLLDIYGETQWVNLLPKGGNLRLQLNTARYYGSGIRVKNIDISDMSGSVERTSYNYDNPNTQKSSGVTSYEPVILENDNVAQFGQTAKKVFRTELHKNLNKLYSISRELPSPGVVYEFVTVSQHTKNVDEVAFRDQEGKICYQFEVFNDNMVHRETIGADIVNTVASSQQVARNIVIKKFVSAIGNVKKVTRYDINNRKLSETINHYLHDGLEQLPAAEFFTTYKSRLVGFNYQGFIQERVNEVKLVQNSGTQDGVKSTFTGKEEYPQIKTGETVFNYLNGTQTSSTTLEFDPYSGAVTESVEVDAYGNRMMTKQIPAYHKYAEMSLKSIAATNKNMLTQIAATYMYKVNNANVNLGLVSAEAQTWSKGVPVRDLNNVHLTQNTTTNGHVWRMESSYEWMPVNKTSDGLTPIANFSDLDYTTPTSSNANWQKVNQISLYDPFSKGLEQIDINGIRSANRFNFGNKKIILSGANCKYFEIAYGNVEDEGIDQTFNSIVKKGDGIVSTADAHTGLRSLKLGVAGKRGLLYSPVTNDLTIGRNYLAMVWVKPVSGTASDVKLFYDIDGVVKATASSAASTKTANGWTLVTLPVSGADIVADKTLTFGCRNDHATIEAYVDDIRFQPLDATTTAYVYHAKSGELMATLDNSNLYHAYGYDAAGRLVSVFKEKLGYGRIQLSEYQYNMKEPLAVVPQPPVTVYAKVVYINYGGYDNVGCGRVFYHNVYINFYSDVACTIPLSVSNLVFNYKSSASSSVLTAIIGSSPVSQYFIGYFGCLTFDCNKVVTNMLTYSTFAAEGFVPVIGADPWAPAY